MKLIMTLIICVLIAGVSLGIFSMNTGEDELSIKYDSEKASEVVDGVINKASGLLDKNKE